MSKLYCIFESNIYKAELYNNMIELTSDKAIDGFENYVDVLGNTHDNILVRKIDMHEAELLFYEDVTIKYKGEYFQLFADTINLSSLEYNKFMICTDSEELAIKFGFEKKEQFVFVKYIVREQIEGIKIIKRPMYIFKDIEEEETIFEGYNIAKWFESLLLL